MQTNESFDQAFIADVVEHMNTDHQDACQAIVRAFSDYKDATEVKLLSMDKLGMDFRLVNATVRIPFSKPLQKENQIRGHLVAMSKQARTILADL